MLILLILLPVVFWVLSGLIANKELKAYGQDINPLRAMFKGGALVSQVITLHANAPEVPVSEETNYQEENNQKMPKRPKVGSVKAPCPYCKKATKHDKEGTCLNCTRPNASLRRRWGIANPEEKLELAPPDSMQQQNLLIQYQGKYPPCPHCSHPLFTDYYGLCVWCQNAVEEVSTNV